MQRDAAHFHICQPLRTAAGGRQPASAAAAAAAAEEEEGGIECEDSGRVPWQTVARHVAAKCEFLQQHGIRAGDVVAVAGVNCFWTYVTILGITAAGGVAALLNTRWSASTVAQAILAVRAQCVLCHESCRELVQSLGFETKVIFDEYRAIGLGGRPLLTYTHPRHGTAIISFTSGSSGSPKPVAVSHRALCWQSTMKILTVGYHRHTALSNSAPLFHVGGLSSSLAVMTAGGTLVLGASWKPRLFLERLRKGEVNALLAVPTMLKDLVDIIHRRAGSDTTGLGQLETILVGGGPVSSNLAESALSVFRSARIIHTYGMTEYSSSITFNRIGDKATSSAEPRIGFMGQPSLFTEVAILSSPRDPEETSRIMHAGEGELLVRGPGLMDGYYLRPSETSKVMLPSRIGFQAEGLLDGSWFRTGDMGAIDDGGNVYVFGRADLDIIRSGAETVHAAEIERCLETHPSISRALVVGVPDERLGQIVAAVVIPKQDLQPPSLTLAALQDHCQREGIPRYKLPRYHEVWQDASELPMASLDKVSKGRIRAALHDRRQRLQKAKL